MPKIVCSFATLLFSFFLIYGCVTHAPVQRFPQITFSHLGVIKVDVAKIEVENRFQSTLKAPHIEHLLPTPPNEAMEKWLKDRFQPVGRSGVLRLIIEDARATVEPLKLDKSFKGQITKQQSERYRMTAKASLHIRDTSGNVLGTAAAQAERSITTREDISLNDRHKLWFDTVSELINDFNQSIEPNIESYLRAWLR